VPGKYSDGDDVSEAEGEVVLILKLQREIVRFVYFLV